MISFLSDNTEIWVMGRVMPGDRTARAHTTMGGCVLAGASMLSSEVGGASMRRWEVSGAKSIAASSLNERRASMGRSWHVVAFGDSLLVFIHEGVGSTELFFTLFLQRLSQSASFLQTNQNEQNE